MKLAEAKNRIIEISKSLLYNRELMRNSKADFIAPALEDINKLTIEKQQLQIRVFETESSTYIAGSSITSLSFVIEALDEKITTLNDLKHRNDLPKDILLNILEQSNSFSQTRAQLKNSIDKSLWQADLK